MKAKKRPIEEIEAADLSTDIAPRLTSVTIGEPAMRKPGVTLASVDELVAKIKSEAVIS